MKGLITLISIGFFLQSSIAQNVGIGTTTPSEKLDVNGGIKIGSKNNTAKGTIRWNETKSDFEGYNGIARVNLTGGKSRWESYASYSYGNERPQHSSNQ
jgi:hypothetical protein